MKFFLCTAADRAEFLNEPTGPWTGAAGHGGTANLSLSFFNYELCCAQLWKVIKSPVLLNIN